MLPLFLISAWCEALLAAVQDKVGEMMQASYVPPILIYRQQPWPVQLAINQAEGPTLQPALSMMCQQNTELSYAVICA